MSDRQRPNSSRLSGSNEENNENSENDEVIEIVDAFSEEEALMDGKWFTFLRRV